MRDPRLPVGEGAVPDKALQELLAAFGVTDTTTPPVDFDDPSIDVLLGLAGPVDEGLPTMPVEAVPVVTEAVDVAVDVVGAVQAVEAAPVITERVPEIRPEPPDDPGPATATVVDPLAPVAAGPVGRTTIKIGGGDDELPDALYFDEEAGDRLRGGDRSTEASITGERTTILIADDEPEGASGGIPIGTGSASMDPRLRARRIAVKRAVGRRRLKWFVLAGVIVVVLTAALAVLGSSLFAIEADKIDVSGARRMSSADLDAALDRLVDQPVLLVDTHSIEVQLERSPWVREARVSTDFPHDASVEILEREPLATYQGPDGEFRILDVEGMVVDVIPGQPIEFMLLRGAGVNASAGTSAGVNFTHATELVEALSPAVRSRTEAVTVSDSGALGLEFHNGATVVFGAPTELLDKLTRLEAYLKRTEGQNCTTTIDVTTAETSCSLQ